MFGLGNDGNVIVLWMKSMILWSVCVLGHRTTSCDGVVLLKYPQTFAVPYQIIFAVPYQIIALVLTPIYYLTMLCTAVLYATTILCRLMQWYFNSSHLWLFIHRRYCAVQTHVVKFSDFCLYSLYGGQVCVFGAWIKSRWYASDD